MDAGLDWSLFLTDALVALGAAFALLTGTWLVARRLGRWAVVDVAWGTGFAVVAVLSVLLARAHGTGDPGRGLLAAVLTVAWGLRLAVHVGRRNGGREDPRYAEIAARAPGDPAAYLYRRVFLVQAAALWFVSLPVQVAAHQERPLLDGGWTALTVVAVLVWAVGLCLEAVADRQLARFTADPASRGRVLDTGLWRYSRHPNYFGDACVWWGLWLLAASAWSGWVVVLSPVAMTLLLTRGSGVPITERRMARTRPGYADYVARTSAFVPLPPRR